MTGDRRDHVSGWVIWGLLFVGLCLYTYTYGGSHPPPKLPKAYHQMPCVMVDEPFQQIPLNALCKRDTGWS